MQGEEKKVGALYSTVSGLLAVISRAYPQFLSHAPRNVNMFVYGPIGPGVCMYSIVCVCVYVFHSVCVCIP